MKIPVIPWLALGDGLLLGLVTAAGFASHGTLESAGGRLLATYLPLLAAWLVLGAALGLFAPAQLHRLDQLWRATLVGGLAGLFAVLARAAWLGTPVAPVFLLVFVAINCLAMAGWRGIVALVSRRTSLVWTKLP